MDHRLRPKEFIVAPADRARRGARGSGRLADTCWPATRTLDDDPWWDGIEFRAAAARLAFKVATVLLCHCAAGRQSHHAVA